jgi:hypothetical protein
VPTAPSADLKLVHLEPSLVKELDVNPGEGFRFNDLAATLLAKGGNAYLILKPTLVPNYEGEAPKSSMPSLHSNEITITTPTGESIKPIGTCTLDGFFSAMLSSTLHLTSSDRSKPKPFHLSLVYAANPAWKECVLNLAGSNYPVKLPPMAERISRHTTASFEILKCALKTNALESGSVLTHSPEMQVMVRPKSGVLLSLDLKVQPTGPNVSEEGMDHPESFALSSGDLEIVPDGDRLHPCAGGEMDGKLYLGTTKYSYLKDNTWSPIHGAYYFTAPAAVERFTLYYKGLVVTHGVISK